MRIPRKHLQTMTTLPRSKSIACPFMDPRLRACFRKQRDSSNGQFSSLPDDLEAPGGAVRPQTLLAAQESLDTGAATGRQAAAVGLSYAALRLFLLDAIVRLRAALQGLLPAYGQGLHTGVYVHWVMGKGDLIFGDDVVVDGKCTFIFSSRYAERPTLAIGDRTHVGHDCSFTVGKRITVGADCLFSTSVILFDCSGHPTDPAAQRAHLPPAAEEVRPIEVGNNVWIGNTHDDPSGSEDRQGEHRCGQRGRRAATLLPTRSSPATRHGRSPTCQDPPPTFRSLFLETRHQASGTVRGAAVRDRCTCRHAAHRRLTVLCYHAVVSDAVPYHPTMTRVAVTTRQFREQLEVAGRCFQPVSAEQVLRRLDGLERLPPRPLLVTFDDGYRNNLTYAAPELERQGIPAVFHLSTGYIGSSRLLGPTRSSSTVAAVEKTLPADARRPACRGGAGGPGRADRRGGPRAGNVQDPGGRRTPRLPRGVASGR